VIGIKAVREGEVPGTHIINYISDVDEITIEHKVTSRDGLAFGAVLAAEFAISRKGFLTMSDMLKF
jgi:4-hydroxy-tetrahydrodipicolinate reductase